MMIVLKLWLHAMQPGVDEILVQMPKRIFVRLGIISIVLSAMKNNVLDNMVAACRALAAGFPSRRCPHRATPVSAQNLPRCTTLVAQRTRHDR